MRWRAWAREPLIQFLMVGAVLYAADTWRSTRAAEKASDALVITQAQLGVLRGNATGPDAEAQAVEAFAEEEALLREARRLGFDRTDLIVRRRLLQKMAFVIEDRVDLPEPTDAELQAWLSAHAARFADPPRIDLEQVFFSRARRGAAAEAQARAAAGQAAPVGDDFLAGTRFVGARPVDLAGHFGEAFAGAVAGLKPGPG